MYVCIYIYIFLLTLKLTLLHVFELDMQLEKIPTVKFSCEGKLSKHSPRGIIFPPRGNSSLKLATRSFEMAPFSMK